MGWTAYYQIVRERALDENERASLAAFEREVNSVPWSCESFGLEIAMAPTAEHVLARGMTKLGMDLDDGDADRICDTLTKLQSLLPDATVLASDDFDTIGWKPEGGFSMGRRCEKRPLRSDSDAGVEWRALAELEPAPAPAVEGSIAAALAELAGGALRDDTRRDEALLERVFDALCEDGAVTEPLVALLTASDPDAVARAGLRAYPRVQHQYEAREAVGKALAAATDPATLTPLFLALWEQPKGTYYYGDLPVPDTIATTVVRQPSVLDRLVTDVTSVEEDADTSDLARRRAERAVELLARSGAPRAVTFLLELVRRWRDREQPFHIEFYVVMPALEFLGKHPHALAVPTLALALDGSTLRYRGPTFALRGIARCRPELGAVLVRQALALGPVAPAALEAAAEIRAPALEPVLSPFLRHPDRHLRWCAEEALEATTGTRPTSEDPGLPPEELVLHKSPQVREQALRALDERRDPSLFRSLALAEHIHARCELASGGSASRLDWSHWRERVPDDVLYSESTRLQWALEHAASVLGEQRDLPPLAARRGRPVSEIVDELGPYRLTLSSELRDQLLAEEEVALAELAATAGSDASS